jgi:protein ImuB
MKASRNLSSSTSSPAYGPLSPAVRTLSPVQGAEGGVRPRELWVGVHLPTHEPGLLQRLAARAQRFTPRVSLVPPDGLLLEVRGSLHLFGGAQDLCRALQAECSQLAAGAVLALAPIPFAALAGARGGISFIVTNPARLVGSLAPLPLRVLRWRAETIDRLTHLGVRTIGQALRLPRAGFARRFGVAQLETLDRLTGRRADPQRDFHPRERFRVRHDLPYELEHHEAILAALAAPLADLERFLRARQCGITELLIRLHHRQAQPTDCRLSLATPEADASRITALLVEKLAPLVLPEPVRICELRSGALTSRATYSYSLWQPGEHGGGAGSESPAFIERLRTRLGADAVYGLELFPEHRPEAAWRTAPSDAVQARRDVHARTRFRVETSVVPWRCGQRPLWLLAEPQPLNESDGQPLHGGALRLLGEPERIETGWWDGSDIARDYYVAVDSHGVRLWLYRERARPHGWYLHGLFG